MRIRTLMTLSTGAALGAGAMYLLDPVHGAVRRRDARRATLRQARHGTVRLALQVRQRAEELTVAAVTGYRDARRVAGAEPATVTDVGGRAAG